MLVKTNGYHYCWYDDNNITEKPLGSFDLFERECIGGSRFELWAFGILGEENRGKGYGQRMLREAIALVGDNELRLYVYRHNKVAVHVYEKAGFRITGSYMGDKAWTMTYFGNQENNFAKREQCCA